MVHLNLHSHHIVLVVGGAGIPALLAADAGNLVMGDLGLVQVLDGILVADLDAAQVGLAAALVADSAGEHTGIDTLDGGDIVVLRWTGSWSRNPHR